MIFPYSRHHVVRKRLECCCRRCHMVDFVWVMCCLLVLGFEKLISYITGWSKTFSHCALGQTDNVPLRCSTLSEDATWRSCQNIFSTSSAAIYKSRRVWNWVLRVEGKIIRLEGELSIKRRDKWLISIAKHANYRPFLKFSSWISSCSISHQAYFLSFMLL